MKSKALLLLPGVISLILAASPVIPSFTNAAIAAPTNSSQRDMKWEQLNLTDAQKAQIKQIRESARQKREAVLTDSQKQQMRAAKQQGQKPNLNLTDDQKAQMKAIGQDTKNQIDALLTADQKQKLQELRASHRQNRQPK